MNKRGARPVPAPSLRVGIDTGGTFTDFVIWKNGTLSVRKVLSTPGNPSRAVVEGLRGILDESLFVVHGTTVATNALLEKKGGRIALIVTSGFKDLLAVGRQTRGNLYDLHPEPRFSPVAPHLCFGLRERILAGGKVETAVDPKDVNRLVARIRKFRVDAAAVSLLHAYANASHENIVARELRRAGIPASISSRLLPEHREYERTLATAVNAWLMPVMGRYLADLEKQLRGVALRIMQSNEGYISVSGARHEPIRTALSGPAGGVVGAHHLARAAGLRNIVSFDMGGTSTDVSLVAGGIRRAQECRVGDFAVRTPVIDIHTVGAGGGSLAYRDRGGSLRVGPQSAGADPGPACYGRGEEPTVTDADLVLGRLDPDFFLGGRMALHPDRSRRAIERLARKIGKSVEETASGIVAVANANMEKAIRVISIERGTDPRNFSLFSFGGAGGMHAVEIAERLRMPRVVIPPFAGVLSAFGLIMADAIKDYSASLLKPESRVTAAELDSLFKKLERRAAADMAADGFSSGDVTMQRSFDLRYVGQSYEIHLVPDPVSKPGRGLSDAFHRLHQQHYAYHHPDRPVEIVNIRIKVVASSPKPRLTRKRMGNRGIPGSAVVRKTSLHFDNETFSAGVYDRSLLHAGDRLPGPCLVVDAESTAFVPPGFSGRIDGFLNLVIERTPAP